MSNEQKKTKNDIAWETLFEKYQILEQVSKHGLFEIDSSTINQERESRLMAKFDHYVNLPAIFKENKLSILPISRSRYVIGNFDTHLKVEYDNNIEEISVDFPEHIESIDYSNLYSENSALNCAFNAGVIGDLVDEPVSYTISGRMSTGNFSFSIKNLVTGTSTINVKNSQCEIDAGFESENYLIIVEAKNYAVDDFLIRQLYYPYRLWSSKVSKQVVPVLMTYSNDVFSFFIYKFKNDYDNNSAFLLKQQNYVIDSEQIQLSDVNDIFGQLKLMAETTDIPFPQADSFERIIDLLSLLFEKDLTKDEITENYQFDVRQTQYYTDACRYIGLVNKNKNHSTKEIFFSLTDEGKKILKKRHKLKYLELIKKILEKQIFYKIFELAVNTGEIPSKQEVCQLMSASNLGINETTIKRRSTTVRNWSNWIWSQID
ncbi:MAG: translation elongation factor [Symploca sp. SIO1C4]|uniref:Translation elongation factor n=1 Tax=Symploca sp. SIO1C4 TaxID=2607765 RepID=A0A6B3N503_9CYAN|nr:translation elongation factor [Symploca sp. SIO1C4]